MNRSVTLSLLAIAALTTAKRLFVLSILAAIAFCAVAESVTASTIAQIEAMPNGTTVTVDDNPVITAIINVYGTTIGSWTDSSGNFFLMQDGTGSIEVNGGYPSMWGGYAPALGDTVSVTAKFSNAGGRVVLSSETALAKTGTAAVPDPEIVTIPQLLQSPLPFTIATYAVELTNVRFQQTGYFPAVGVSGTYNITDGTNSMQLALSGSYTSSVVLDGTPIPTGPVNIEGWMIGGDLAPLSITPVPEPGSTVLLATGLIGLLAYAWRNRK